MPFSEFMQPIFDRVQTVDFFHKHCSQSQVDVCRPMIMFPQPPNDTSLEQLHSDVRLGGRHFDTLEQQFQSLGVLTVQSSHPSVVLKVVLKSLIHQVGAKHAEETTETHWEKPVTRLAISLSDTPDLFLAQEFLGRAHDNCGFAKEDTSQGLTDARSISRLCQL